MADGAIVAGRMFPFSRHNSWMVRNKLPMWTLKNERCPGWEEKKKNNKISTKFFEYIQNVIYTLGRTTILSGQFRQLFEFYDGDDKE